MLINIFGCPGSGKSTLALRLTGLLKSKGRDAEYVHEHIKTLIALGDRTFNDLDITSHQFRLLNAFHQSADIVVTDSPILNPYVYCKDEKLKPILRSLCWELHLRFPVINVLLEPTGDEGSYRPSLRYQSYEQSLDYARIFRNLTHYHYTFTLMGKGLSEVDKACKTIEPYL